MLIRLDIAPCVETVRGYAEDAVKNMWDIYNIHMDYSLESLAYIDEVLAGWHKGGAPVDQVTKSLYALGSYAGEVLLRYVPGTWVESKPSRNSGLKSLFAFVRLEDGHEWRPIATAFNIILNGPEISIQDSLRAVFADNPLLEHEISSDVRVTPELLMAEGKPNPQLQEIKAGGRIADITPKAQSQPLVDAAAWFRRKSSKLDAMIDKSQPLEAQIMQAQKLQQQLMEGAVATLSDPELGGILREAFARPSIEKLKAEVGGSGLPQLKAILDRLTAPDTLRKWFEPGACFAAGTLVNTKAGLVPIEQIKVGDWVLSKPENGGAQAYKQVVQTFAHPPQRVVALGYYIPAKKPNPYGGNVGVINCTLHHPFWVKEMGWTAVSELDGLGRQSVHFEDLDGEDIPFSDVQKIYISDQPNVGWLSSKKAFNSLGALWDYANHRLVATDVQPLPEIPLSDPIPGYDDEVVPDELFLHLPVYNLEVEDFHTYYVGKHGLWVHNTNCGG